MKKQISMEDMAELICSYYCDKGYCPCDCKNCDNHKFAEEIIKDCLKIRENAVVLTREEYNIIDHNIKHLETVCNNLEKERNLLEKELKQARKETAREIFSEIYKLLFLIRKQDYEDSVPYYSESVEEFDDKLYEIAKQYGFDM